VTDRKPTANAQLAAFLSRFPAKVVALAKGCLTRLRRAFPGTLELVYDYRDSLVVAFGPSERGQEAYVSLAVSERGVRLYLRKDVPDPKGLLEGSGTQVRSVALESASDLDRGDVHALLVAAVERVGDALPRSGPTSLVIKSGAKAKKPGKTKRA
jgi:hypothetical protein